ncbi:glycosyl hydrolase [Nesterenkonia alba]|uniref:glycosyl hydrolase n=1 Tax=Nesterenkonia alba TaxID=515814 RepID=UPI0003FC0E27|nr:glycosyl hydrolase [Nesterenkonia alba]
MSTTSIDHLRSGFGSVDPASRVLMRWWWFGPDVDRGDLVRDLDQMVAAGLGGVECAFVYPMGAGSDRFLSESFLADVGFAAREAVARGLRFDLTLGSGWPYGGPHVDESIASRRIEWIREEVPLTAQRIPVPVAWPADEFIAAYIGEGTRAEPLTGVEQLATESDETGTYLLIPQGRGPRTVLVAISRVSGQSVKRAGHGAEGWVLDHLSAEATRAHIQAVAEPLVHAAGVENITTVFCDSLEVYDAGWTPDLIQEFTARRGYDPTGHLWKLTTTSEEHAQFRADWHRTQTQLAEENFIAVMNSWAESKGLVFRIQGYGQPPVTISSYRYAGAIEGEGWGWDVITAARWASSAAQIYGHQVVSSETWTWNHSPSFRSSPLDILAEAHDHLLMGINQFIGHGWPTSPRPEEPSQLGRVFYASGAFDDRNAWWTSAAKPLWETLHRLSWLMRQGTRLANVGIYLPTRDIYAGFAAAGRIDLYKEARLYIGDELPHLLRTAGLDFDLFDDDAVEYLDPGRFDVVVLPYASDIPASTRQWLGTLMRQGTTVLDLGATARTGLAIAHPAEIPGFVERAPVWLEGLSDGARAVNDAVAVTTRQIDGEDGPVRVHLAANTSNVTTEVEIRFDVEAGGVVERWDPETARVVQVWDGVDRIALSLQAYEAAVLVQHRQAAPSVERGLPAGVGSVDVSLVQGASVELRDWTVQFPGDEAPEPVTIPHQWESQPGRELYSGTAVYTTEVSVPEGAQQVVLDLGEASPHQVEDPAAAGLSEASFSAEIMPPVGVVATVSVDGQQVGAIWKTPYRLDLTGAVTPGATHQLQLQVANVSSHALAADTALQKLVQDAEENFGRRFGIQTLELALADVASGLLAVPQLRFTGE